MRILSFIKKRIPLFLFIFSFLFLVLNINFIAGTDIGYWVKQVYNYFPAAENNRIISAYPALTLLNISGFSVYLKSIVSSAENYDLEQLKLAYKIPLVFIISFFIPLLFVLLKKMNWPEKTALIASLLVLINPMIWQANGADILLAVFSVLSILLFIIFFRNKKKKYLFLSSLTGALAVSSRFSGMLLFIVIFLLLLYYWRKNKIEFLKIFKYFLVWFLIFLIVLIAVWPQLIITRGEIFKEVFQKNSRIITFKSASSTNSKNSLLERSVHTFTHLPLLEIFLLFSFLLFIKKHFKSEKEKKTLDILLIMIFLFIFYYFSSLFIRNSIWCYRYALPAFIFLDLIIALELIRQVIFLKKKFRKNSILFLYFIFLLLMYLPGYYYFNF